MSAERRFDVAPEVFAAFPGMSLAVAVVDGLDNALPRPAVAEFWRQAWEGGLRASAWASPC